MDQNIKYDEFPARFPHCLNEKCTKSSVCLHYQINTITPDSLSSFTCFNPSYIQQYTEKECPHFLSSEPKQYAKGCLHLFDHIPYPVALAIKNKMKAAFGPSHFYRLRGGQRLISPKDQQLIKQFFKEEHIDTEPVFDTYIDYYELS